MLASNSTIANEAPALRTPGRAPLAVAMLGFFVVALDAQIVSVALPAIGDALRGGLSGLQWVVTGYTLTFSSLLLFAGTLSDRIGARRAYALGMGIFVLASAACGFAPSLGVLVAARVAQGVGAALITPTSLALIREAYDDAKQRAKAVAYWALGGSVAAAAGPILGGVLTEQRHGMSPSLRGPPTWREHYQDGVDPSQWLHDNVGRSSEPSPGGGGGGFVVAAFNALGSSHTSAGGKRAELASGPQRTVGLVELLDRHRVDIAGLQEFQSPKRGRSYVSPAAATRSSLLQTALRTLSSGAATVGPWLSRARSIFRSSTVICAQCP